MYTQQIKNSLIILGAGKPIAGSHPSPLKEIYNKSRVLDWVLDSFNSISPSVTLVTGYHAQDISDQYQQINYVYNQQWQSTGSISSLFYGLAESEQEYDYHYVSYSDVLFRKEIIEQMYSADADIVITADSQWKSRYIRDSSSLKRAEKVTITSNSILFSSNSEPKESDLEFAGLIKLSKKAVQKILSAKDLLGGKKSKTHLPVLLNHLAQDTDLSFKMIDAAGNWSELDDPRDLARFVLGTKSQTLSRLQTHLNTAIILDQQDCEYKNWINNHKTCIANILEHFQDQQLIVRSSAENEDGFFCSNAGAFLSVANVKPDTQSLKSAIDQVFDSYTKLTNTSHVLIQPMLLDTKSSGVVFSRTLNHGAPYLSLNYVTSSDTSEITSGSSQDDINIIISKDVDIEHLPINSIERKIVSSVREIEELIGIDSLDIEFAIDKHDQLYILQVRPIAVDHNNNDFSDQHVFDSIKIAQKRFASLQTEKLFLYGKTTYFGIMPDWNPAEIIGTTANKLASSLYQYIITDEIWALSRMEFGYKDVRSKELMTFFCGRPYIDIRASLNSFLPYNLSDSLSEKLVNYALEHLYKNPWLHDKIEFEVMPTCFSLDFELWQHRLNKAGFSSEEIAELRNNLIKISRNAVEISKSQEHRLRTLEARFDSYKNQDIDDISKIRVLLNDCKYYGTIAFANLARCAFVAVTHLKGLLSTGLIRQEEHDQFLASIQTVAHDFLHDASLVKSGQMKQELYYTKYGHLRPGTYDIKSESYINNVDKYLLPIIENATNVQDKNAFSFSSIDTERKEKIIEFIHQINIDWSIEEFEEFLRYAIASRENYKFIFTKNLSLAIDLISNFCKSKDIDLDTASNIPIKDLLDCPPMNSREFLITRAAAHICENNLARIIELPATIFEESQFLCFAHNKILPNFITNTSVDSEVVLLANSNDNNTSLTDKIVIISHADPGYDWIFSHNIKGLITKYGGANSHMAIRCAEFALPAAIGVGEVMFEQLKEANSIMLDCNNKLIKKLR